MRAATILLAAVLATAASAQDTCSIWAHRKCGSLVEPPNALARTMPAYPRAAKLLHQEGFVQVYVDITADGVVSAAWPTDGPDLFRAAAVDAARRWRFKPARINHRSVPSATVLTFRFVMTEAD
ncbi:MAG TPA: TonB family protein [Thermoanaerobaculia bacterium]|nr:TonB family protein [Thermoanaerobaculia bacterium]